jgi:hypothetical protein
VDLLPREAHAVEHARAEILDEHVAVLDQAGQHLGTGRVLGVERDRALVVVEHGEIQAIHLRDILQLAARDVADAGPLNLDHVRAEPSQQLGAGRPGLDVREVQNANAVQRLAHRPLRFSSMSSG